MEDMKLYRCWFTGNSETLEVLIAGTPNNIKAEANKVIADLTTRGLVPPIAEFKLQNFTPLFAYLPIGNGGTPIYATEVTHAVGR